MEDCKREGKEVCAWTVNSKEEMVWCARWGIKAIITDRVAYCVNVRKEVRSQGSSLCDGFADGAMTVGRRPDETGTAASQETHLPLVIMEVLLGAAGKPSTLCLFCKA